MGIPEYEAKRYEGRVKEGGILLSVHCDNSEWVGKAKDLLKKTWRRGRLVGGRKPAPITQRVTNRYRGHGPEEVAYSGAVGVHGGEVRADNGRQPVSCYAAMERSFVIRHSFWRAAAPTGKSGTCETY